MPLSDVQIRSLKPRDRVYKVSDAHSLYIEVHPTGARLWRFKYTMHGKQKRIALRASSSPMWRRGGIALIQVAPNDRIQSGSRKNSSGLSH